MTTANIAVPKLRVSPNSLVKRGVDIAGSSVMLIICAPLFAVVAALIKLDSEGPALFRQKRIGKDGEIPEHANRCSSLCEKSGW